jgi:hypothetical protein
MKEFLNSLQRSSKMPGYAGLGGGWNTPSNFTKNTRSFIAFTTFTIDRLWVPKCVAVDNPATHVCLRTFCFPKSYCTSSWGWSGASDSDASTPRTTLRPHQVALGTGSAIGRPYQCNNVGSPLPTSCVWVSRYSRWYCSVVVRARANLSE